MRRMLSAAMGLVCGLLVSTSLALPPAGPEEVPVIGRPPGPLVIDGRLEDAWRAAQPLVLDQADQVVTFWVREYWKGPQTLSGKIYLLMDDRNLYLGAEVSDDYPLLNDSTGGESIMDGSSVLLYFGGQELQDIPGLVLPNLAPFEFEVTMGLGRGGQPVLTLVPHGAAGGAVEGGELAALKRPDGAGYVLEAKIPLSNFRFTPREGQRIELDVGLNHTDGQPGADGRIHGMMRMMWHGTVWNYLGPRDWGRAWVWKQGQTPPPRALPAPSQVQATVRVAGDTAWQINGDTQIRRALFGARIQGNTKGVKDLPEFVSLVKEAGFESFFYYIYPQNLVLHGDWEDPDRPGYPKPALYEHPEQVWGGEFHLADAGFDNLRLAAPQASFLLCLQSPPPWMALKPIGDRPSAPADPEEYARLACSLLQVFRTDPRGVGRQALGVSFMNEPDGGGCYDSEDFYDDPTRPSDLIVGQKGLNYYIKSYRAVAERIRADFPDLLVGGPVAQSPLHRLDWWVWKNWTIKFLDDTGSLTDYYDFHPYADFSNDPASIQAQATMIMNHVLLTQKRPMPCVLSEQTYYGYLQSQAEDPASRFQQLLWNQRVLFMELDHPDKFAAHYYFLGYDPRVLDYGALQGANLWRVEQGRLAPYPIFYLYRAMRDLRGTRLYAESSQPDVLVRAALNGNKLSVLVFNDAHQAAAVDLALALPAGTGLVGAVSSGWSYDSDKNEFSHFEDREVSTPTTAGEVRLALSLAPFATESFTLELSGAPETATRLRTEEYYADRIFVEQAAETHPVFRVAIPEDTLRASQFALRLGWEGAQPQTVQVGPSRYPVPGQRQGITDIRVAEIPVKPTDLSAVTEVRPFYETTYPNINEKILFVSLVATGR